MEESGEIGPEMPEKTVNVCARFETEKGSKYEIFSDGSGYSKRIKYDGTRHITKGVTVFLGEEAMLQASRLYANQDHLPKDKQQRPYLMEDYGDKGLAIYNAGEITDPDKLVLVVVDGNNKLVSKHPATLIPTIGSFPFQQSMTDKGLRSHLGHEVVDIDRSQKVEINLRNADASK
jgi:hypothetical protein